MKNLDYIDMQLLEALQTQGRTKRSFLAQLTGLSIPAVGERLKKLEECGVISSYHATLNHKQLGWDVTAFINTTVDSSAHFPAFLHNISKTPEVLECHAITGDGTHLLKVRARNTKDLEKLLSTIQSWDGVVHTTSQVALSSPKESTQIPLATTKPA